ncbi:membrane protein [Hoeflea halophila]|uniref:Membrane protein n=1 Tax=Hoeflea halophila TaxID=714899 RepID=A0A286IB65_9HYPH|nr:YihY/virulence factor BrkB family protein [Hoeflea halophila]SOE17312.1 membrane protein [Hoeflea halophila]
MSSNTETGHDAFETGSGRGRAARSPLAIPARGWFDILKRVANEISADNLLLVAGGATFYMLLAMVPFISAVVSIYGLFSDPTSLTNHIAAFSNIVPQAMLGIIEDQLIRLTSKDNTTLGLTLIVSVGLSLWSANAGMKSIFQSLNVVYDESEKRGFVRLTLTTLVFTIAAVATILVLAGTVIVLPVVFSYIPAAESTEWLVQGVSFAVMFAIIISGLTLLYRYGPSRSSARWGWLWIGAIAAAVLILVVSLAFTIYVSNFAKFDETYGSLGAIIGFMMWLWLMISVVLIGAEVNAEIEHHTIRDTTVGERQPMGQRGAVKADAVPWSSADDARGADTERQDTVPPQLDDRPPAGFAAGAFVGFIVASLLRERR